MGNKYVECRHTALVKCKVKDGSVIDFYPFVINKYTGQPAHSGFTQVTEEQIKVLTAESKVFAGFVKSGLLVVRDNLPASAQTPQSILISKDMEIAQLKAKIAELEKAASVKEEPKESKKAKKEEVPADLQF